MDGHESGTRLIRRGRVGVALLLALLGAAVVGVLGWLVDGGSEQNRVDRLIEDGIDSVLPMQDGVLRLLGEAVSDLGSPPVIAVTMLAVALLAYLRRGPRALALVLAGPPVAMVTTSTILKPIIGRTRGETLAYPSGHTTSATSVAVVLTILVLSSTLTRARKVRWTLALGATVLGVGVSLIGRDYHYATDTIGAVGLAVAVVVVAAVIIDAMADSMALDPDPARPRPVRDPDEVANLETDIVPRIGVGASPERR